MIVEEHFRKHSRNELNAVYRRWSIRLHQTCHLANKRYVAIDADILSIISSNLRCTVTSFTVTPHRTSTRYPMSTQRMTRTLSLIAAKVLLIPLGLLTAALFHSSFCSSLLMDTMSAYREPHWVVPIVQTGWNKEGVLICLGTLLLFLLSSGPSIILH